MLAITLILMTLNLWVWLLRIYIKLVNTVKTLTVSPPPFATEHTWALCCAAVALPSDVRFVDISF